MKRVCNNHSQKSILITGKHKTKSIKAKRLKSSSISAQDNQTTTGSDNKRIHMKTTKGVHGMQIPMLMYSDESRLINTLIFNIIIRNLNNLLEY